MFQVARFLSSLSDTLGCVIRNKTVRIGTLFGYFLTKIDIMGGSLGKSAL